MPPGGVSNGQAAGRWQNITYCPFDMPSPRAVVHQNQRPLLYGLANTYFEKNISQTTKTISQLRIMLEISTG